MPSNEVTLQALTGGVILKQRVQRPRVHERTERIGTYWFFRYRLDEIQPDGTIKTTRKFHTIGPSRGKEAIGKRKAEAERDAFLANLNAAESRSAAAAAANQPPEIGAILFGKLAELWRYDHVERQVGNRYLLAATTRDKYIRHLENHILPRWKDVRISEIRGKLVLDWLLGTCTSWGMIADLRNMMSGIFTKAQEWEILPDSYANPIRRVKLPKKWDVRPKRILNEEQTVRVLAHLEDPHLLICETCLATGTRISEVLGLQLRHLDLDLGVIRIEQRNWHGDIDVPKTEKSKRILALGTLVDRYRAYVDKKKLTHPDAWMFPQEYYPELPLWDSATRAALKKAAVQENCDFPGFGPHSLRRANITWRQEVGGSSIETSRIAGHASTKITEEYTVVQLRRQDELTRRIQAKLVEAADRPDGSEVA